MKNLFLLGFFVLGTVSFANSENQEVTIEEEYVFCRLERCDRWTFPDGNGGTITVEHCYCVDNKE